MTALYIAEKKLSAENLAAYLSKTSGIPSRPFKTHIIIGDDTIVWLSGHVLELSEPEVYDASYSDRGNFSNLPIVPNEFILKPVERWSHNLSNFRDLLKKCSHVIHFGDPDREGQMIVDELLYFYKNTRPVTRLWARAMNDASFSKAIQEIKSNSEYYGYYESALARRDADWIFGINMSRAVSIAARKKGSRDYFTVGRVQTPTLALVVARELEIRKFTSKDFYIPWIEVKSEGNIRSAWSPSEDDDRLDPSGILVDKLLADSILEKCSSQGNARVEAYETTPGTLAAPLPFSLSALQLHCQNLFGYSPANTLSIAQSLYLKKITSYPRTSSDYLPESQHEEAPMVLTSLAKSPLPTSFSSAIRGVKMSLKSKAFDDKEQAKHAHHAIVPVPLDNPGILSELTPEEKNVFGEIVKRFVLQFWPAAKFINTKITFSCGNENFVSEARKYTDEGWKKAFGPSENDIDIDANEEDTVIAKISLPLLSVGDIVSLLNVGFDFKTTKPPKRFNGGTLLNAMKNVHKYVQDPQIKSRLKEKAGIGTEATRAETIKGLIDRELLEEISKELRPTKKGERLIQVLPQSLTSPDMTAMWESFMDIILSGKNNYSTFIEKQKIWIQGLIKESVTLFDGVDFPKEPGALEIEETEFKCLKCNHMLRHINGKRGWFFGCSNAACKQIFNDIEGVPVESSKTTVPDSGIQCPLCKKHSLVKRKRADGVNSWWSCSGWTADKKGCNATFSDIDGTPDFEKKSSMSSSTTSQICCPGCKEGHLVKFSRKAPNTGFFWSCNRWREGCKSSFSDKDGFPDMEARSKDPDKKNTLVSKNIEKDTKGSEGEGRGGSARGASVGSASPVNSPPVGNRFMAAVQGRGTFGGTSK